MTEVTTDTPHEGVVCPFCGLFCDDLVVEPGPAQGRLRVTAQGCAMAQEAFAAAEPHDVPRIDGRAATLDEACARAAAILTDSRLPVIGGLAADITAAKAATELAERVGAIIDHAASEAMFRNLLAMFDKGWMATTLAEVKNRMDLLIVAGTDIVGRFPRFFERCVWNTDALFWPAPSAREVVYLGDGLDTTAGTAPDGRAPTVITCDSARLAEIFAVLRAVFHGRALQATEVAGAPVAELSNLVERMKSARYGVITWAAGDLAGSHSDLAVQAISDLVTDLNETGRFSCLPLGGTDNALGAAQVCTWQSGFPLRTSFASGHPDFDPHLFSWRRLIEDGGADSLLWVSAFRAADLPVEAPIPTIVVGAPGIAFDREPDVYVPVGIPGLDHGGHVVRTDAVASLPLRRLRESKLPRTADVLHAIAELTESPGAD